MAERDHQRENGMQKNEVSPKSPTSPKIIKLLRGREYSRLSPTTSPRKAKDDDAWHPKKSVLAKVKEKAKKWRLSLNKKKHEGDGNATPSWGVSLEEESDYEEEDPEYLGAPMYESEMAPQYLKDHARQEKPMPEKQKLEESASLKTLKVDKKNESPKESSSPSSAPASLAVKRSCSTVPESVEYEQIRTSSGDINGSPNDQVWDKGISIKEYIMNKLEPGEDEKALSEVISQAISPKKNDKEGGVIEKVKEVVTSLLHNEDCADANSTSDIPVATDSNQGKILQPN